MVDGVVYAGWVAIGFAAVEDVTYFADTESPAQLLLVFVLRAVLTPFAHPLFTMWIGLAIGRAVRDGRPLWPHALWGYAAAVAAHALWNGSLALAAPDPDTGDDIRKRPRHAVRPGVLRGRYQGRHGDAHNLVWWD